MSIFVFANNVNTFLAAALSTSATVLELQSTANLPTIPAGQVFAIVLNDAATQQFYEIVYVTAISGANLTVLRGQEGTAKRAWNVGDLAYDADTAGILSSFVQSGSVGNYVLLNPGSAQAGSINITGSINASGPISQFAGLSVNGPLSGATTGAFSGHVAMASSVAIGAAYTTPGTDLSVARNNSQGAIYFAQGFAAIDFGLTHANQFNAGSSWNVQGNIVASSAVISGSYVTATNGRLYLNAGDTAYLDYGNNVGGAYSLVGAQLYINGVEALTNLTSSSGQIALVRSGNSFDLEVTGYSSLINTLESLDSTITVTNEGSGVWNLQVANASNLQIGMAKINSGNGGGPTITLPAYGSWFVEIIYGLVQTSNNNLTITLSVSGGSLTGFVANADGTTAFNSNAWITIFGKGTTEVNNQTITFNLSVSGGSLSAGSQPWMVRATRTD